ncbi:Uncharacterised protein (plasmid) [Legionella adelaidensis]|uniref:Uncharacterized protein n=1 Tax=Legionella adelaidensis TaxID=45056 RepID=A0A0W0R365_9GAMM|nr:hypothetical protein [Legionella adelaidensis]KTC65470.1 hypothetical protein Lade_0128 [Legionella adelaidensis]VEH84709.1 Uncharacterised protein [Legionella adelaidensis]
MGKRSRAIRTRRQEEALARLRAGTQNIVPERPFAAPLLPVDSAVRPALVEAGPLTEMPSPMASLDVAVRKPVLTQQLVDAALAKPQLVREAFLRGLISVSFLEDSLRIQFPGQTIQMNFVNNGGRPILTDGKLRIPVAAFLSAFRNIPPMITDSSTESAVSTPQSVTAEEQLPPALPVWEALDGVEPASVTPVVGATPLDIGEMPCDTSPAKTETPLGQLQEALQELQRQTLELTGPAQQFATQAHAELQQLVAAADVPSERLLELAKNAAALAREKDAAQQIKKGDALIKTAQELNKTGTVWKNLSLALMGLGLAIAIAGAAALSAAVNPALAAGIIVSGVALVLGGAGMFSRNRGNNTTPNKEPSVDTGLTATI